MVRCIIEGFENFRVYVPLRTARRLRITWRRIVETECVSLRKFEENDVRVFKKYKLIKLRSKFYCVKYRYDTSLCAYIQGVLRCLKYLSSIVTHRLLP